MAHIHVEPGQHDITVSAYIVRTDASEPLCLVHMHRKMGKLMQAGGHVELDETPWSAVVHEIAEETGFATRELRVLQQDADRVVLDMAVNHPTPFCLNTHSVGNEHFHTDLCFGFLADGPAERPPADGESTDVRWLTLPRLRDAALRGEALEDVSRIYAHLIGRLDTYAAIAATEFSLDDPTQAAAVYRVGAPGR